MSPEVVEVTAQRMVAAPATEQGDVGRVIMPLFDRVWAFLGQSELRRGHNVVVYRSLQPAGFEIVEAGVQVYDEPAGLPDGLVESRTPAGKAARALHVGPYSGLAAAAGELARWCTDNGHTTTGLSWEVYGDWNDDESKLETEIYFLLR
jgi:effector-binding domain-containing protein